MTNAKRTKQTGLGAASYFEDVPSLDEPAAQVEKPAAQTAPAENKPSAPAEDKKIRRTYALSMHTQLALETMKLAARKQGENITLGDLMEEAVQLLLEKKGIRV